MSLIDCVGLPIRESLPLVLGELSSEIVDEVFVVDGFGTCGTFTNYGVGIPAGSGRVPDIRGSGCAATSRRPPPIWPGRPTTCA